MGPRVISPNLLRAVLKPKVNYKQSVRCTGVIAPENDAYFDDAALRAAKPFEDLPSETMVPLLGTGWVYLPFIGKYDRKYFSKALLEKRKEMGDIFREKLGPYNFVVSFNADDVETMYKHEGPYPSRTELETIRAYRESRKHWYSTLGVSILNGKEWLDLRKKTQKYLMKPKAVLAFLNPMQDVARDFIDKISRERDENKEITDLLGDLNKWSLESIALVGLDSRLGCLDPNLPADSDGMKMIENVQISFDCVNNLEAFSGNLPFWKIFPTPTWKKFTKACDIFTEIAFKHINRSVEKMKTTSSEDQELTLMQSMLLKGDLDVSSAMVMVSDMMLAGIETTSNTIGFFLKNMAKNPEKQELLYQHLKEVLPRKEDRITPELFNELRYLKACIKESQRLDPIVGGHVRTSDHDVIFSGHRIPAGEAKLGDLATFVATSFAPIPGHLTLPLHNFPNATLLVVVQGIFRDERYYSKPDEFLPERWLNKDEKFHPFAYLPFGFGTRSCIGRRLAELEIICLAAELIRNFKIEYHHEEISYFTRLINVPDKPLRFTFIER